MTNKIKQEKHKEIKDKYCQLLNSCMSLATKVSSWNPVVSQFYLDWVSYYMHIIKGNYSSIDNGLVWPFPEEIQRKKDSFKKFLKHSEAQGQFGEDSHSLLDHVLWNLIEECNEVSQRITKCMRFGCNEKQPGQDLDNLTRLRHEFADLLASYEMLCDFKNLEKTLCMSLSIPKLYPMNENGDILDDSNFEIKKGTSVFDENRNHIGHVDSVNVEDNNLIGKIICEDESANK